MPPSPSPAAPPPSPAAPPPSTNSTSPPPSSPPPSTNSTSPPPASTPPSSSPPPASPPPSAPPPASASPPPPASTPPPSASPPPTASTPPPSASPPPASSPPPSASPPPASSPPPVSSPPPQAQPSPPPAPPGQSPPPGKPPPPSGQPAPSGKPVPPKSPALPPPGQSPPTGRPPPPPPSKSSVSTPLAVGIAVGSLSVLAILGIIWFCFFRKRRRDPHPPPYNGYYGGPSGSNGNLHGGQRQNWQHNAPPPADDIVKIPPQPPPYSSRPPNPPDPFPFPPPPPALNSSGGSISNDSGSGGIPLPGLAFGSSKSLFTYNELALATNGFSDANLLGQGGFGYVHKGTLPNGREVAVKQLKSGSGQGEREFQAEVEIISRVHHKHLVSLVGYCISGDQRLLVYEYVPNKTLDFHLHGKSRPIMDWSTRLKIALGSAKGLAYLHEDCYPKIIHRDIKGSNILLDYDFEAKVADFGLAKFTSDNQTHISTRVMGSFGYIAPEYASSGKLTDKSDVYSFGVVLLELITGKVAYDPHRTSMDDSLIDWARPYLTQAVENGNYDALVDPWLEKNYNPDEMSHMVACAAACVRYSARNRPRMSQIVRSLEGDLSLEDLNSGVRPGHSTVYGSSSSSYDSAKYNDDMKNFKKLALDSQEYGSSEYSAQTSEYGLNPSVSSSEGQQTLEMEMMKKKDGQGFSSSSH